MALRGGRGREPVASDPEEAPYLRHRLVCSRSDSSLPVLPNEPIKDLAGLLMPTAQEAHPRLVATDQTRRYRSCLTIRRMAGAGAMGVAR